MPSERLIEHFRNPRNVGELPPPALQVDVVNPACGDMLRLCARIDAGRVAEVTFKARGCVASIAASSALTELIAGKTRDQLLAISATDIEAAVDGLEYESKHAAQLCLDAVRVLHTRWQTI
ncbi:MAG TPA: iron-sulfur cluster assembly scaffold protein [Bryobacteraceae bacterium]|nr:iron-sulfur cluster assembly scaffold protein [Bryobacteraceae bacterium]